MAALPHVSALRLIVGHREGKHGLSWTVFTGGDDIYVKVRSMQGAFKISVHPPGPKGPDVAYFYGFEESWLKNHPEGMEPAGTPRIEQYQPKELGPGVRRILSIRVHPEAVVSCKQITKADSHIWVEPLPDRTVELHLLLAERTDAAAAWCRGRSAKLIAGILDETNLGDVLVYVSHREAGPPPARIEAQATAAPASPDDLEAVAFGIDSLDGSVVVDEMPVRTFL